MLIWMLHKKDELMIIRMSTKKEACQIRGQASRDLCCWTRLLQRIDVVQGGGGEERLTTTIQATSRPDHIWPDAWTRIGKATQRREKQGWEIEKPNSNMPDI